MTENSIPTHPCPAFIAAQVRYWRKSRKLTQKDMSSKSGIKYRHFQEIESGRVDIKIRTLGLIAMGLEVTPHLLLKPVKENWPLMCESCKHLMVD